MQLVYDNYNALAIGFGPSERASEAIFSIVLYPRWVTLFFLQGAGLADPKRLLKGSGKVVRHIVLASAADLDLAGHPRPDGQGVETRGSGHRSNRAGAARHPLHLRQTAPAAAGIISGSFCNGSAYIQPMRSISEWGTGIRRHRRRCLHRARRCGRNSRSRRSSHPSRRRPEDRSTSACRLTARRCIAPTCR